MLPFRTILKKKVGKEIRTSRKRVITVNGFEKSISQINDKRPHRVEKTGFRTIIAINQLDPN